MFSPEVERRVMALLDDLAFVLADERERRVQQQKAKARLAAYYAQLKAEADSKNQESV